MLAQRRFYYAFSLALTLLLFGVLGAMGLSDRNSLKQLVEERGPLELGTALLWGGLSTGALVLAFRGTTAPRSWFALAALSFFFAGEEVEWGHELPGVYSSPDFSNAHNWAAGVFVDAFAQFSAAVSLLGAALVLGTLFLLHRFGSSWLRWGRIAQSRTPMPAFFAIAIAWLAIATTCDLIAALGLPYLRGQWVLEETSEFLAAVSACTGIVAHLLCAETRENAPTSRIP